MQIENKIPKQTTEDSNRIFVSNDTKIFAVCSGSFKRQKIFFFLKLLNFYIMTAIFQSLKIMCGCHIMNSEKLVFQCF